MADFTFLIVFLFLIVLTAVIPQILKRLHVSFVIALMLIGIVIGPNALNVIQVLNDALGGSYPTEQIYAVIDAMGLLGLVFLMALAGMEVNLNMLSAERCSVTWLSILTFSIPAAAGYAVYAFFRPDDEIGKWVYASLFASHSVGIVFPVMRELKAVRTRFGVAVLASTVITDIASLVLLAICIQFKRYGLQDGSVSSLSVFNYIRPELIGSWFPLLLVLAIVAFILFSMWFVPVVAKRLFASLRPDDDARVTFFLACTLFVVFIGELVGVNLIVGAFVAGMALVSVPAFHDDYRILHKKLEGIGYGFIIPFLFLTIGMKTNLNMVFAAWSNAVLVGVTLMALVCSKVFSGWLAMKLSGFDNKKGLCAGLMTVPQLTATLAAAAVALQLNMINEEFFNAIIFLSIGTTLPIPGLIKLLIVKGKVRFDAPKDLIDKNVETIVAEEDLL